MPDLRIWTSSEILRLRRELDRQFARLCEDFGVLASAAGVLFLEDARVTEEGDRLVVRVRLSGVRSEDIDVHIEGSVLTIASSSERAADGGQVSRSARMRLRLPCPVDPDKAEADYAEGELTITMPRCEPRSIPLKTRTG